MSGKTIRVKESELGAASSSVAAKQEANSRECSVKSDQFHQGVSEAWSEEDFNFPISPEVDSVAGEGGRRNWDELFAPSCQASGSGSTKSGMPRSIVKELPAAGAVGFCSCNSW